MLAESPRLGSDAWQREIAESIRSKIGEDRVRYEYQCPRTGYLIDIVIDNKLAIEVDGKSHFFGERSNGPTNLKTLLLTQAGWKVHRISCREKDSIDIQTDLIQELLKVY